MDENIWQRRRFQMRIIWCDRSQKLEKRLKAHKIWNEYYLLIRSKFYGELKYTEWQELKKL